VVVGHRFPRAHRLRALMIERRRQRWRRSLLWPRVQSARECGSSGWVGVAGGRLFLHAIVRLAQLLAQFRVRLGSRACHLDLVHFLRLEDGVRGIQSHKGEDTALVAFEPLLVLRARVEAKGRPCLTFRSARLYSQAGMGHWDSWTQASARLSSSTSRVCMQGGRLRNHLMLAFRWPRSRISSICSLFSNLMGYVTPASRRPMREVSQLPTPVARAAFHHHTHMRIRKRSGVRRCYVCVCVRRGWGSRFAKARGGRSARALRCCVRGVWEETVGVACHRVRIHGRK